MIYVTIHAAWMIVAVVFGTIAGYMGLLRAGLTAIPLWLAWRHVGYFSTIWGIHDEHFVAHLG